MSPAEAVRSAIARAGCDTALLRDGGESALFPASIQPRVDSGALSNPTGYAELRRYILYASAQSPALKNGDVLRQQGREYRVYHAAFRRISGEALYQEALLYEGGEV